MGEVFRARDTRLDRSVAIKVLPSEFATNSALRLRFDREAKTISGLNHPHICSLFDVGESGERSYLVMEFLDGESLADRIAKGPLPIDQVLKVGIEIASALDTAHRNGIVHRDIKPGNIMLTRSGAKLLDFGLAKSATEVSPDAPTMATQQKPITEQGAIIGTFQYMAPEQVEGRPADARSDIFALGAVVYEMATGQRAFDGKTRASVIAAILDHEPPPISVVRPLAPMALDRVVRATLRKDPDDRVQTAHDLMLQLTWLRESTSVGEGAVAAKPRRRFNLLAVILGATTLAFAGLYAHSRWSAPKKQTTVFSVLTTPGIVLGDTLALSPDGKTLAYVAGKPGQRDTLWVRSFANPVPRELTGTVGAQGPFWSPDGQWIAFFAGDRLRRVNVATGSIHDIYKGAYGVGAAWSPDGSEILFCPRFNEGLFRVPATGGEAVAVTKLDRARKEIVHGSPRFLPDGEHYVALVRTNPDSRNEIAVGSIGGGPLKRLIKADSLAGFARGSVLYVIDNILYAHRFDVSANELRGTPVELARDVTYSESWTMSPVSVVESAIAYAPIAEPRADIRIYDRRGNVVRTLLNEEGVYAPRLSPDGKALLITKNDSKKGAADLWIADLERGTRTRVTTGLSHHMEGAWSPDGTRIAFISDRAGMYDIYMQTVGEAEDAKVVWKSDRDKLKLSWMPDGGIVTSVDDLDDGSDLYVVKDGRPQPLLAGPTYDEGPAVSPDGKWLAFSSYRGTRDLGEIFVLPTAGGRAIQVSSSGGSGAAWSPDSSELFFVDRDSTLMYASVRSGVPGPAHPLFQLPRIVSGDWPFSVTPDGNFLIAASNQTDATPRHVNVVTNW